MTNKEEMEMVDKHTNLIMTALLLDEVLDAKKVLGLMEVASKDAGDPIGSILIQMLSAIYDHAGTKEMKRAIQLLEAMSSAVLEGGYARC